MIKGKLYELIKPLTLKHLYTEPAEVTVTPEWGKWEVISSNKSKKLVKLRLRDPQDPYTRIMRIYVEVFNEYFKEVS